MILIPEIRLYHGSYCEASEPDLQKCRNGKDFGRGFYLTTDKEQAIRFTRTAIKKAIHDKRIDKSVNEGIISEYVYKGIDLNLCIHEFEEADSEWLHCVVGHRKTRGPVSVEKWKNFDIIAGKIANDNTNLVIVTYMDGLYGEVGSEDADRIAIGLLEPDNLSDQICFRTERALETVAFVKSERVVL